MKKIATLALMFIVSSAANAATVYLDDGDIFEAAYPTDQPVFIGSLTEADPRFSVGFETFPGYELPLRITAPEDFDLVFAVSTGRDFGGVIIVNPNDYSTIFAGTFFDFVVDGNYFIFDDWWVTIEAGPEAIAIINSDYGGSYSIGGQLQEIPGETVVPIPPSAWLFGSALFAIPVIARRRKNKL